MSLPWIKVATDLPEHPKARALAKRLNDTRAWAWPVRLWLHAARFAPDGRFRDLAAVEEAAGWEGKRGVLGAALQAVRFLDKRNRGFALHGWAEWAGAYLDRLRRDRLRKRQERAKASAGRPQGARGTSADVHPKKERRGEGEGDRDQEENIQAKASAEPEASASARAPASAVVLTLKCSGKGPATFDVTEAMVSEWRLAFPGVDVLAELRKSAAWQDAHPNRRKTHRGMAAHLVSWLGRAQDGAWNGANATRKAHAVSCPAAPAEAFGAGGVREIPPA